VAAALEKLQEKSLNLVDQAAVETGTRQQTISALLGHPVRGMPVGMERAAPLPLLEAAAAAAGRHLLVVLA